MPATSPSPIAMLDLPGLSECLQQAPDGVVILDHAGQVLLYNQQAEALCGIGREQVLGQAVSCLLGEQEYAQLLERLHAGTPSPEPLLLHAADHPRRSSSLSLTFSIAHAGDSVLYIGIARDVGAQLQQQRHVRQLSRALDCSDNGILLCDQNACVQYANEGFARMFGHRPEAALGKRPRQLIQGRHTDVATLDQLSASHEARRADHADLLGYHANGNPLWLSVVSTPLTGDDGGLMVNIFTDITAAKTDEVLNGRVLDALVREDPLADTMTLVCREIERVAPDLLVCVSRCDADGGMTVLAAPGMPPSFGISEASRRAARRGRPVEIHDLAHDTTCPGGHIPALAMGLRTCWSNPIRSTAGQVLGVMTFHGHEPGPPSPWHRQLAQSGMRLCALALERELTRSRMHRLAFYDSLTGLPNRLMFNALCEQPLQRAEQHPLPMALLFIGLDRFKRINESQGHAAADGLLCDVSRLLQESADANAVLGRQLGDEFVMLVPNCSQHQAAMLCEDLLARIAQPRVVGTITVHAAASIGVAMYPEDGLGTDTLLQHADLAMRQAKGEGGGRFRFFSLEMNRHAQERLLLEASLRESLQQGGLRLHYQPQVHGDGSLYGAEALLRWRHPQLGDIPPGRFVPLAEECGLMNEMSQWVLEEACRQQAQWRARGIDVPRIAVNLSASTFELPSLVEQVNALLQRHQLPPESLVLEITESVMLSEQPQVLANLHALHAQGMQLSLDDFGTGYSSLSHLHRLPISEMKLDRSFISEIGHDAAAGALIRSVLRIGESLGKHVVAEGVETEEQRRFLTDNGSPVLQGYLFSAALPADALEQWLQNHQLGAAALA